MASVDDDRSQIYELAHEQALRVLADQQTEVDSLRTRPGILLSGAAIATSFLSQEALMAGLSVWSRVALIGFMGLGFECLLILWPRERRRRALMPSSLIDCWLGTSVPPRVCSPLDCAAQDRQAAWAPRSACTNRWM